MNANSITLELDAATAELLNRLAQAWGVSTDEAVRRAVSEAKAGVIEPTGLSRLEAFRELQGRLQITPEKAAAWQAAVHEARR